MKGFDELELVARTVWAEGRGEPFKGQVAIAHVIFNRVEAGRFGVGPKGVCSKPNAFSCWRADDPNRGKALTVTLEDPSFRKAVEAVLLARSQRPLDVLGGCTHYFADSLPEWPRWAVGKTPQVIIGHHAFFNGIK
jgi:N-acetylmuramoyl-L-alanine amidase